MKNKLNYIFGPVPSRRLGISLGVDLVPHKTCSLDCIYCECGKTTKLTLDRQEYIPTFEIIEEIDFVLKDNPKLDYITFSGSGEPTLHSGFFEILRYIKSNYPQYKTALLTNATMLVVDDFYEQFFLKSNKNTLDLIVPSLDAISAGVFRKINRPHHKLNINTFLSKLKEFCLNFQGEVWLEIFIVPKVNDSYEEILLFKDYLSDLKVSKVQLNTLDRPSAYSGVSKADKVSLDLYLNTLIELKMPIEVTGKFAGKTTHTNKEITVELIENMIKRRPCTKDDLLTNLNCAENDLNLHLEKLEKQGKLKLEKVERGLFYRCI